MLTVKIVNTSEHPLPQYATQGAAGMDLRASIETPILLPPQERILIPTGISIELPIGYEAQIRPRSGLAAKKGVVAIFGTVDSDYRGQIHVLLLNTSKEPFVIENGERIAQMVIAKHETIIWELSQILSPTERGEGGFGSTGIK
ncbi:MAG: dUTP diphosphatase [Cytophagales bacterium]|nr:MAG: dUTP diphosphatase [Cytophagales bacterium]